MDSLYGKPLGVTTITFLRLAVSNFLTGKQELEAEMKRCREVQRDGKVFKI